MEEEKEEEKEEAARALLLLSTLTLFYSPHQRVQGQSEMFLSLFKEEKCFIYAGLSRRRNLLFFPASGEIQQ